MGDRQAFAGFGQKNAAAPGHDYRPDIDGLRAIAVLLVVFFHAGIAQIGGGFVGVDIFFVISGFLITGIIVRELDAGHFTFAGFYARRIKRILPALFAILALSILAAYVLLIPDDLRMYGRSIVSTVLFYSNWLFYKQVNYFDGPAIDKPLLHTWSLSIEEQFYLIWPLLLLALYRAAGRKALPRVILALFAVSLVASQAMLGHDPARSFYLLPYRAWELMLGAYLAVAPLPVLSRRAASFAGLAGFAAIAYAALAFDSKTPFPGLNALFPCLGAAILIATGLQRGAIGRSALSFGPLRLVGKISYSLYLVHWPIFSFAHLSLDGEPSSLVRVAMIAASFVLATLSYRYVETPARRATIAFPKLARAAAAAAVVMVLPGVIYENSNGLPWRVPAGVQIAHAAKQLGLDEVGCRINDPKPAGVHHPCPVGVPAPDLQYDFVIWGDSHAHHLAAGFSEQAQARGLAGLVISQPHCTPMFGNIRLPKDCEAANARAREWLPTQKKLKMVFLAAAWGRDPKRGGLGPRTQSAVIGGAEAAPSGSASEYGLDETLNFIRSLGVQVTIVGDIPSFPVDVPNCAARARMFGRSDERCFAFPQRDILRGAGRMSAILDAIGTYYGVPILETVQAFCDETTCRSGTGDAIFYADGNHLNGEGSRYLAARLNIAWPASATAR
jgi:peptidoglycan/LPS O-acetylase OafA/YrhL